MIGSFEWILILLIVFGLGVAELINLKHPGWFRAWRTRKSRDRGRGE